MTRFLITHRITHDYTLAVEADNKVDALLTAFGTSLDDWTEDEIARQEPEIEEIQEEIHD